MIILATILGPFLLLGQPNTSMPGNNSQHKSIVESKVRLDSTIIIRESTGSKEKTHFLYNSEGYNTECINYEFDKSTNKWVQSGIETCTYDSAWNLTSVINDGQYKHKQEFNYDKTGDLQNVIYYQQDNSNNWYEFTRDEYVNNQTQNKIYGRIWSSEHCIFYFNNEGKITNIRWAETDSLEFKYDGIGNIITKTHFYNDQPYCPFVVCEIEDYYYDTPSNSITSFLRRSQFSGMCWDSTLYLQSESKFYYDKGFTQKDLILPYVFNFNPFTHYLGWYYTWNFLLDFKITERINVNFNRIKYYYSDQTITGIEENTPEKLCVYPNPATDHIKIDVDSDPQPAFLEIYDLQGRVILKEEISQQHQISVRHLKRGMYLYKIKCQDRVKTGKVVLL